MCSNWSETHSRARFVRLPCKRWATMSAIGHLLISKLDVWINPIPNCRLLIRGSYWELCRFILKGEKWRIVHCRIRHNTVIEWLYNVFECALVVFTHMTYKGSFKVKTWPVNWLAMWGAPHLSHGMLFLDFFLCDLRCYPNSYLGKRRRDMRGTAMISIISEWKLGDGLLLMSLHRNTHVSALIWRY